VVAVRRSGFDAVVISVRTPTHERNFRLRSSPPHTPKFTPPPASDEAHAPTPCHARGGRNVTFGSGGSCTAQPTSDDQVLKVKAIIVFLYYSTVLWCRLWCRL